MTAAKKMTEMKAKIAALKAKKADAEPTKLKQGDAVKRNVLDMKAKLKKKEQPKEVSCFTIQKEREKLQRFGIEAVVVAEGAEVRVDTDLIVLTMDPDEAVATARNLYSHIRAQAEKLAEAMKDDE